MIYVHIELAIYVEALSIIYLICYYYLCIVYCRPLYELYLCIDPPCKMLENHSQFTSMHMIYELSLSEYHGYLIQAHKPKFGKLVFVIPSVFRM